jgi:hypothetical protein
MLSDKDIAQIMRDMVRVVWNEQNVDLLGEFVHDDYHALSSNGRYLHNIHDLREDILETMAEMQGLTLEIDDMVIHYDGDKHFEVAMFLSGTYARGDKAMVCKAADLFYLNLDGKIVERRHIVIQEEEITT